MMIPKHINSIERSPHRKANISIDQEELPRTSNVSHCVRNSPQTVRTSSQFNPLHALQAYLLMINLNINHQSMRGTR
jgi:hypothetical protein